MGEFILSARVSKHTNIANNSSKLVTHLNKLSNKSLERTCHQDAILVFHCQQPERHLVDEVVLRVLQVDHWRWVVIVKACSMMHSQAAVTLQ